MEEGEINPAAASPPPPPWQPRAAAFRPWTPSPAAAVQDHHAPRVLVGRPLVARFTKDILETFQICNPAFTYSEALNPKRFLTSPSTGVLNSGYDNENSDLILHVNLVLINMESKQRYVVKDMLGQGTFGQVARCLISDTNSYVAVKIIKNQPAYYQQALVEVAIVKMLNQKFDPDDKHHIVRILDHFVYQQHLCISFEMLGSNLFELIKANGFKGLSLSIVQMFSRQILHALVVMKDAGIIHCDLKPENILISRNVKPAEIKIIDFGSACAETRTVYSYIQSRYYRSPEVLLGYPYTTAIDMWSFGCIVAELFLGLPLFPGASEYDLVKRMIEILSAQPPDDLLRDSKNTSKFFMHVGGFHQSEDNDAREGVSSAFRILTEKEYETKDSKVPSIGKRYFKFVKLEDIIVCYPYRKHLCEEEITKEKETRLALVDLLRGLLEFDPGKRWSPLQASRHPFLTGERFVCPYKPPPETPRIPVSRTVAVDYNQGGRHWLGAGLSPQVSNVNNCLPHNSPQFQMGPLIHGGSYGSLGSHGSYNDNAALGSSYGSYGEVNNMYAYYSPVGPSGLSPHGQVVRSFLGASPDARLRPQLSHGNGFGASPTGGFGPMSLGASPSQYTPPSSQMHYGSTSPARGHVHGSPLGKAAAIGQYNRRRHNVYPGNSSMQPHDNTSQQWQGHHSDGLSCSYQDAYSRGHIGSPRSTLPISNFPNRRQQMGVGNGLSSAPGTYQSLPGAGAHNLNVVASHASEVAGDKSEASFSVPNPGDWDPCYSEEQLLQEENSDVRPPTFGPPNDMCLGSSSNVAFATNAVGRLSLGSNQANAGSNYISSNHRTDAQFQVYTDGSPPSSHDNMRAGYNRMPHCQQTSTSRFGHQPVHRGNHMHSTSMRNEHNHQRSQAARSSYSVTDTHSSSHPIFANGMSWGRRAGLPISTTVPSPHERKDYGRI